MWEIDNPARNAESAYSPPAESTTYHNRPDDLSHSRTTSLSSLLPMSSRTPSSSDTNTSSSAFADFLSRLTFTSTGTAKAKYKTGVAKAPEYKRVNVVPDKPSPQFNIDGSDATPGRNGSFLSRMFSSPRRAGGQGQGKRQSQSSRATTLPSVLDIRMPSRAPSDLATTSSEGAAGRGGVRGNYGRVPVVYGAVEQDYDSMEFSHPPRSDFTLTTNDLMTPTDTSFTGGSRPLRPPSPSISARADSDVLPPSPFASSPLRTSHSAPHLNVPKPTRR